MLRLFRSPLVQGDGAHHQVTQVWETFVSGISRGTPPVKEGELYIYIYYVYIDKCSMCTVHIAKMYM